MLGPMEQPLLDRTLDLLRNCDVSLPELANMSGLGYEWLKKLKAGEIPDPGVNRIQKLHDFLAQRCDA
jgi:hypothetical protein